jgi:Protein of unknown function (DUF4013)
VTLVAASFAWPFRGAWPSRFALGSLMVLLLPIAFIPLLGYAIAATRAAEDDPTRSPPPWTWSARLFVDGFWTALAILLLSAPFIAALNPLVGVTGRALPQPYSQIAAISLLALPWGLLLLLLMPHGASRFAATGRPLDLFDFPASLREVKRDFLVWNLVAAAIVTAWVLAIACVGLLCAGILPGTFYAILVSAHAAASLHQTTAPASTNPPAG